MEGSYQFYSTCVTDTKDQKDTAELETKLALQGFLIVSLQKKVLNLQKQMRHLQKEQQFLARRPPSAVSATSFRDSLGNRIESRYWTPEEHRLFLEAVAKWGRKNVQSIALHVGTRTIAQVRSHAQKYFQKQRKQELEVERAQKLNADIKAGGKDGGKSNANDVKTVAVQSSNTARVPSQQAAPLASSKVIRVKTESSSNRTGSSERAHNNMTNVHQNEPVSSSNQKVVTNNSNNNNSNANRIYPSSTSRDLFATTAATHSVAIHLPIDTKRNIVKRMPPTQKTNAAQRVMLVNNPISVSVESDSKNVTIASRVSSAANNKRKDNNTAHDLNVGDHSNVPTPTVVVKSEKV